MTDRHREILDEEGLARYNLLLKNTSIWLEPLSDCLSAMARAAQEAREQALREAAVLIQDNVLVHGCGRPYLRKRPESSIEAMEYAKAILALIEKEPK